MSYLLILPAYFVWHYGEALSDIFRLWTNFIWFFYNFFSIPVLLKTLFSPWQRISEVKTKPGFHVEDIAEVVVANFAMRLVGAIIRVIFIILGTITVVAVAWLGLLIIAVWFLLPVLVVASFIFGLSRIV